MRHLIFCSGFITLGVVFLHFSAVAQTDSTSVPVRLMEGLPVVQVTLNGKGPYDFILDTGSNITWVRSTLLAQLSIALGEQVVVQTATGVTERRRRTIVESMGVGGLTVLQNEVDAVDPGQLDRIRPGLSGVLGENFLKHFDILLDNDKKTLVLDRTTRLAKSLHGERLPFSRFGSLDASPIPDRIIVELKIPSYRRQSLSCLVDSGSSFTILYPETSTVWNTLLLSQPSEMHILYGLSCIMEKSLVVLGGSLRSDIEVGVCEKMTREASDSDCLLPTYLFKEILISHLNSYVIVNPRKGSGGL